MTRTRPWLWVLLCIGLLLAGCRSASLSDAGDAAPLMVTVSVVPQQYFVERIGGDYVEANVMVAANASPHTYEPKPEQLAALSKSVAYFSVGVSFENVWLGKIAQANPAMLIVDTSQGVDLLPMADEHEHEGEAEPAAGVEGELDPHIWVSPQRVKIQARTICETLVQLDPAHEAEFKANYEDFVADIDRLEADIRQMLRDVSTRRFMVFHPAWGYFADDFGLEQIAVEVGGQEPSAQELAELIDQAKAAKIKVIFAQPEFSTVDAQTIAREIGGEVLLISPLAYDWLENMRAVAATFKEVLQ